MMTPFWDRMDRLYLAGAAALPPVGTAASAVLVDFAPGAIGSSSVVVLTKRSCIDFAGSVATGIIEPRGFGFTHGRRRLPVDEGPELERDAAPVAPRAQATE